MRLLLTLCILGIFLGTAPLAQAQCNPEDQIESWYDWAKGWENYAVDQLETSEADEMEMGNNLHQEMSKEQKYVKKHPKQAMLDEIMNKLTAHVERPGIKYTLHVIDDDKTLNAFSIAGGHVYITTKMIDWVSSEDELAFVLAHEVAHVDNKHSIRKVQKLNLIQSFSKDYSEYKDVITNVGMMVTAPLGQMDEYDADRSGATIAVKAGYKPRKGLAFFERMAQEENYNMIEKVIRTHPYSAERHNCLDSWLKNNLGQ
ncbi:MAG: M48 family metalloprotease [Chitinophagales bacterium]